jgi:cell division protein FtsA
MPPGRDDCQYASVAGIIRYITNRERNPYRYIETPISTLRMGPSQIPVNVNRPKKVERRLPGNESIKGFVSAIKRSIKELF